MQTIQVQKKNKFLAYVFVRECSKKLRITIPLDLLVIISIYHISFEEYVYEEINDKYDEWYQSTKHYACTINDGKIKRFRNKGFEYRESSRRN